MNRQNVSVIWFRRDLRLSDNEAVHAAASHSNQCLFVFVIDPWFFKQKEIGWLRVKFMLESLAALDTELAKQDNRLIVLNGNSVTALTALLDALATKYKPTLFFNHDIQVSYGRKRDEAVVKHCKAASVDVQTTHNYFLLHNEKAMSGWWKQYYGYQSSAQLPVPPVQKPEADVLQLVEVLAQLNPQTLSQDLDITVPKPVHDYFHGGEPEARAATYYFLKDRVDGYHWKLSRPFAVQQRATSLIGPHLAFGTISTRAVYQAAAGYLNKIDRVQPKKALSVSNYLDRLRWRDSFTQRLWFHPEIMWQNRFPEFDTVYADSELSGQELEYFERWKHGNTGFPLLDAAMRQLAADGHISFRMRAMAATFLTINCGVSWHHGARHFMNCLVDGDIAINHWQWQMQAGVTNPLSPTFRIYSPTKNLKDRDANAAYVHEWLPDTRGKNIETILKEAQPMLDYNQTRKINGKVVADIRKQVRDRILAEKGSELAHAQKAHAITTSYKRYTEKRYHSYKKTGS